MPATITVTRLTDSSFRVTVEEGGSRTVHEVTASPQEVERFGGPGADAERLVGMSFEFLLEREPKEAILPRFSLATIERYFPEYATVIRQRL
jgi:hypothetical protein